MTLALDGGTLGFTEMLVQSGVPFETPIPTKPGYYFNGWKKYVSYGSSGSWTNIGWPTTLESESDMTLAAQWVEQRYNVTYVLDGGTNNSNNPTTYYMRSFYELYNPTREGYDFVGWFDENDNKVWYLVNGTYGDIVLTARWESRLHGLIVVSSDESKGTVAIIDGQGYGAQNVTVEATPCDGFVFLGWYDIDDNCLSSSPTYSFTMPANDYTLKALFLSVEENNERLKINRGITPVVNTSSKIAYYGLYPQTRIKSSGLIAELNSIGTAQGNGWYLYEEEYYAKVTAKSGGGTYSLSNNSSYHSSESPFYLDESSCRTGNV